MWRPGRNLMQDRLAIGFLLYSRVGGFSERRAGKVLAKSIAR